MDRILEILDLVTSYYLHDDEYLCLINELDVELILDNYDLFKKQTFKLPNFKTPLFAFLYTHRKNDVLKYYENNYDLFEYEDNVLIKFLKAKINKKIKIDFIRNLSIDILLDFMNNANDPQLEEFIFNNRKEDITNSLNELINAGTPTFYFNSPVLVKYISKTISKKTVIDLLDYNKITKKSFEILYEIRKRDINKYLNNVAFFKDKLLLNILHDNLPYNLLKEIMSKPYIKNDTLKEIMLSNKFSTELKNQIYYFKRKKYNDIIDILIEKNEIIDYMENDLPMELENYIVKNLLYSQLVFLLLHPDYAIKYRDRIYEKINNKNFIEKMLENDIDNVIKIIKLNQHSIDLKNIFLKYINKEQFGIIFKYLPDEDKLRFYNENKVLIEAIIINDLNNDNFFFENYINKKEDTFKKVVIEILSNNDLLNIILREKIDNPKYLIEYTSSLNFKTELIDYFSKQTNKTKLLNDLKKIYNIDDHLFTYVLTYVDFSLDILLQLLLNYSISIKDKEFIAEKHAFQIEEYFRKLYNNNPNNLDIYLKANIPTDLVKTIINLFGNTSFRHHINGMEFSLSETINKELRKKYLVLSFDNTTNKDLFEKYVYQYNKDDLNFAINFDRLIKYLKFLNIDVENFFQYTLNSSYDYINDLVSVMDSNPEAFKKVYELLSKKIFNEQNLTFDNLFLILKNFIRYNELCISLLSLDNYSSSNIRDIKALFNSDITLSNELKPTSINECKNIYSSLINEIKQKSSTSSVTELKDCICLLKYNITFIELQKIINTYGNIKDYERMLFDNQYDYELSNLITQIIDIINEYEILLNNYSILDLEEILEKEISVFENNSGKYIDIEKEIRKIFSYECNLSLLKIDDKDKYKEVYDKESSEKYGVKCYDFRNVDYILAAHVLSKNESIDQVVKGVSNGEQNFISLSSISYLNQKYYTNGNNIILGYDEIPPENFVMSSIHNIGSNSGIKKYSTEVSELKHIQRNMLELSKSSNNNEVLCYRKGLKPKYIIVPNREPTELEINYAKTYDLIIVKTQDIGMNIENPKLINTNFLSNNYQYNNRTTENTNKIAIVTDCHGLYQPLLEVLDYLRNKGVTEIYSLGDNIGTGPNPSEVVHLLEKYNVKSIKGNHEHYIIESIKEYLEHLKNEYALSEAQESSEWTKEQLTNSQYEIIKEYPEYIELDLNGKKVLLIHHINDYNTNKPRIDTSKYDLVIQGHTHFRNTNKNVETLRGLAIGEKDVKDINTAVFYILTNDEELKLEEIKIPYKKDLLIQDLNKKTYKTKKKIKEWVGEKYEQI